MGQQRFTRRALLRGALAIGAGAIFAACQPKVVEKIVKETVIVEKEKEVEKPVEKVVEKTVVVEKEKVVEKVVTAVPTAMGPITINLFARGSKGTGDLAVMEAQLKAYNFAEKFPNIKIEEMGVPSEQEYLTKLLTMAAGGKMGSVFWNSIGLCNYQRFAIKGMMIDLIPFIEAEKFDIDDFYPGGIKAVTLEGKLYCLPWRVHPGVGGIAYNRNLFQEAGVPEPQDGWTLEDLVSTAKALTKDTNGDGRIDQWGYVQSRQDYLGWVLFIRAFDGWEISDDWKTCLFNTPEAVKGLTWHYDTYWTYKIQPPAMAVEKSTWDMMLSGKIAMFQTGMWAQILAHQVEEAGNQFEVRAVPFPKSPKGKRPSLFEVDGISIASMLRDELVPFAWELVKALTSTEAAAYETHYCCSGGRKSGFELAKKQKPLHPCIIPYYTVLDECMEYRTCWNYRSSEYDETVKAELEPLWLGKEKPTQAFFDKVTKRIQEILDLPMPV